MTAAVQIMSPPDIIQTDPQQDLRSSIHESIAQFNGVPVRPSVVAAANRNRKSASQKTLDKDAFALQALLCALAFTPTHGSTGKRNSLPEIVPRDFVFDSPVKPGSTSAPTTPWQGNEKRRQATPPTASCSYDEGDAVPDDPASPVPSPAQSPVRSYADLSLPLKEISPNKEDASEAGSVLTGTPASISGSGVKRCKKFPTVDTNIPGAGTLRSSMAYKKGGAVRLPFCHINEIAAAGRPSAVALSVRKRKQQMQLEGAGPAHHAYESVKDAWTWGKGSLGVLAPLMDLTEGAISATAGLATGHNDLKDVDHKVLTPLFGAVDQHVVNPVLGFVGGIFGKNSNDNKKDKATTPRTSSIGNNTPTNTPTNRESLRL